MSARIRASEVELAELGETEDGVVESTAKLQKYIKGITGFDILEKDGKTFKSLYDILLGIGKEFQNLDDVTKAALSEKLFGKRMGNIGLAVLNDTEQLEAIYEKAMNAEGSAMREQENYAKSVQYSIDQLKASAQELANDVVNSQFLKGGIEALTKLVNIVDELIKKFGVLGPLVAGIGIASSAKSIGVQNIATAIMSGGTKAPKKYFADGEQISAEVAALLKGDAKVAESAEDFVKASELLKKGATVTEESAFAMDAAGKLIVSAGISIGVAAAAVFAYKFANSGNEIRQMAEDAGQACLQASDDIDEYKDRIIKLRKTIDDSSSSYEEVYAAQQELYSIQNEMISQYDGYDSKINLFTDSVKDLGAAFDELKNKQNAVKLQEFEDEKGVPFYEKILHGWYRDIFGIGDGKKGRPTNVDVLRDEFERTNQGRTLYDFIDAESLSEEYKDALLSIKGVSFDENMGIYVSGTIQEMYDALVEVKNLAYENGANKSFLDYLDASAKELKADLDGPRKAMYDIAVYQQDIEPNARAKSIYDDVIEARKAYDTAMKDGDEAAVDQAIENYKTAINKSVWDSRLSDEAKQYIQNMFPEMQDIIDRHEFKLKFTTDPNSVDNRAEVIDALRGYSTAEEAKASNDPALKAIAEKYKISPSELIDWSAEEGFIPYDAEVKFDEAMQHLSDTPAFGELLNKAQKWDVGYKRAVVDVVKNSKTAEEALEKIADIDMTKATGSAIDKFADMTSGFDQIGDILADLQNGDGKFDYTKAGNSKFAKTFSETDIKAVEEFQKAVLSSKGVMTDEVQQAANGLADAYVHASLAGVDLVNTDTEVVAAMLETQGVTNATEYATYLCAEAKAELAYQNAEEASSSYESEVAALANLAALNDESGAANDDALAFRNLMYDKLNSAITVGSSAQIAELAAEAEAVGILASSWRDLAAAKAFGESIDSMGGSAKWKANAIAANNARIASLQSDNLNQLNTLKGKSPAVAPNISRSGGGSGGSGGGGGSKGSGSDKEKEDKEVDWMERRIKLLQKQYDLTKKIADDEYKSYDARIEALREMNRQSEVMIETLTAQSREYEVNYEKAYEALRKLSTEGKITDKWDQDIYGLGSSLEEVKKVNDEINATFAKYGKGNLDYNNRPYLHGDEGEWITMITEGKEIQVGDAHMSLVITPLLEGGREINLDEYLAKIQQQLEEKAANGEEISLDSLLALDTDKLIVAAREGIWEENEAAFGQMEAELQPLKDKAIELRDVTDDTVKSLRMAIESGALDISKFPEEIQKAIEDLINYYDKWQDKLGEIQDEEKKIKDTTQEEFQMRLNMIKAEMKALENERDLIQHDMDMREVTGSEIIQEADYEDLIDASDAIADNYREQLAVLEEQKGTLDEGTEAWYNVVSQMYEVEGALRDIEKQQAEWNETIKQLPIRRIQRYLQMLENIKKDIQNFNAEEQVLGINPNQQSYTDMFEIDVEALNKYKEELDKLRENLKTYTYGTDKFEETANSIQECEDNVSSLIQEMREYNTAILNIPIDKINAVVEKLEQIKSALEEVQADNDLAINAAITLLGDQIEKYNDQISETEKIYQDRIDALQEEADANAEQLAVEKARYQLQKMMQQNTKKVNLLPAA